MSIPLHVQRRRAVVRELLARGARRILDLGCGEGRLVADLLREPTVAHVTGVDVSTTALRRAAERLHLDELSHRQRDRVSLLQSAVVDATNVQRADRARVVQLAKDADCHAVAVVLDVDVDTCPQRNSGRHDRRVPRHAVARHVAQLRRSRRHLRREGFRYVFTLDGPEEIAEARVERTRLWVDRSDLTGPFDIIGDVHGCREELVDLLARLGYGVDPDILAVDPPAGRMAIFLGDLVDRGPDTPGVVRLVRGMVQAGTALCVAGNHENKLVRSLSGRTVQLTHGLPETLAPLSREPARVRRRGA